MLFKLSYSADRVLSQTDSEGRDLATDSSDVRANTPSQVVDGTGAPKDDDPSFFNYSLYPEESL